jgi:hypothetical protein
MEQPEKELPSESFNPYQQDPRMLRPFITWGPYAYPSTLEEYTRPTERKISPQELFRKPGDDDNSTYFYPTNVQSVWGETMANSLHRSAEEVGWNRGSLVDKIQEDFPFTPSHAIIEPNESKPLIPEIPSNTSLYAPPEGTIPFAPSDAILPNAMYYPDVLTGMTQLSLDTQQVPSQKEYYSQGKNTVGFCPNESDLGYETMHPTNRGTPMRSSLLEEFRTSKNKKIELKNLVGHFVEFSGDQHGSRFIQQKLESASVNEKQMVFQEIAPSALTLMTDVFGNYVIQKFFEYGTSGQKRVLGESLMGHVLHLTQQMYGCRVVQKALETISEEQQAILVQELNGHIIKCIKDQNGNHVVQKIVEKVPRRHTHFIVDALVTRVYSLATHPYGCRVIQRILEHHYPHYHNHGSGKNNYYKQRSKGNKEESVRGSLPHENMPSVNLITKELLRSVARLVQDQYGNYVIQHVLEHGTTADKQEIVKSLCNKIVTLSQHKFASNVIEKCIQYGTPEQRQIIIDEICKNSNALEQMMKDQYANYVVQKILDVCDIRQSQYLITQIQPHLASLRKFTYGKHIIARMEKIIGKMN